MGHWDGRVQFDGATITAGEGDSRAYAHAKQYALEGPPDRQDQREARHRHPRQNAAADPYRCTERHRLAAVSTTRASATGLELLGLEFFRPSGALHPSPPQRPPSPSPVMSLVEEVRHRYPARYGGRSMQVYGSAACSVSLRSTGTGAGHSRRPLFQHVMHVHQHQPRAVEFLLHSGSLSCLSESAVLLTAPSASNAAAGSFHHFHYSNYFGCPVNDFLLFH